MCEYCCKDLKNKKWLSKRTEYSECTDCYVGMEIFINENILEISSVAEVGYPSRDSTLAEKNIEINYCPMCGKKLSNNK